MRERIEGLIGLASPLLNLMLAAGDRVSRVLGPEDEYYPIRAPGEGFELPGVSVEEEPDPEEAESPSDA